MSIPGLPDSVAGLGEGTLSCPICGTEARIDGDSCVTCLLRAGLGEEATASAEDFEAALRAIEVRDNDWRLGDHQILEEIGRGGMGRVLEAVAKPLQRSVAVKVLLDRRKGERRFVREARITGQLEHPSVVPVHELGVDEEGRVFYTMKLVKGVTLRQILQDLAAKKPDTLRNYALPALLTVFQKACDAVAFAHAQSAPIIHRDLKPDNIMVGNYGEVLVMDWGAAKILRGSAPPEVDAEDFDYFEESPSDITTDEIPFATRPGLAMGTPGYMAPEQARGEAAAADERTDIFALGAILYSLLTLESPVPLGTKEAHRFKEQANTGEDVAEKFAASVLPLLDRGSERPRLGHLPGRAIPNSLVAVVLKAMALDSALRYAKVLELQADVAAYQRGFATGAEEAGPWKRLRLLVARNKTLFAALATTFVILLTATTVSLQQRGAALESNKKLQLTLQRASLADHEAARQRFRVGAWREGLALMGRSLTFWPGNRAAANYLLSAIQFGHGDGDKLPVFGVHHDGAVCEITFSPDGLCFATSSYDHTTQVWDTATGRPIGKAFPYAGNMSCFSSDGRKLITTGEEGIAQIWDVRTGAALAKPMRHGRPDLDSLNYVMSAVFSKDGRRILTGSFDHTARIWDASSGEEIAQLVNPERVADAVFSPDGSRILTSYWYGGAMLWDANTFQPIGAPMKHGATVRKSLFTPDGNRIITSSLDNTARIWDGHTAKSLSAPLRQGDSVWTIDVSPDGRLFATAGYDKTVRLWSVESGAPVGVPMFHGGPVNSVAFSKTGEFLLSASRDKTVRLWDVKTCQQIGAPMRHDDVALCAIFSPDSTRILSGGWDHAAYLWETAEPTWPGEIVPIPGEVVSIAFDRDDQVFVATRRGEAGLWSLSQKRFVTPVIHSPAEISGAAFHAATGQFAVATADGVVRFWNATTGAEIGHTSTGIGAIADLAFSADGHSVFVAYLRGTVLHWKIPEGTQIGKAIVHSEKMDALAVAPSGNQLATGCRDDFMYRWDTTGENALLGRIRHTNPVHAIDYSPDGRSIATGCDDHTARIWSIDSGQQQGEPFVLDGRATTVRYTDAGNTLLVGGVEDTEVSCYDTRTHHGLVLPLPHPAGVRQIISNANGSLVVTVTNDGVARIWRIPTASGPLPNWLADYLSALGGLSFSAGQQLAQVPTRDRLALRGKLLGTERESSIWDPVLLWSFQRDGVVFQNNPAPAGTHTPP
ncbi:MAG: protein kinase [Chthoniobacterales bacterium]